MKTNTKERILSMVEGAVMIALAVILDLLPFPKWPQGGSVSVSALPIVYFSYRRGPLWGTAAGLALGAVQLVTGWYAPPAGTFLAVVLCVILDYLLAFGVLGLAVCVARLFGNHRLVGYGVGAAAVGLLRFLCSFLSGFLVWGSYAPEGQWAVVYSLLYNGSYMLPNAVICAVLSVLICMAVDPLTLRPMKKS